MSRKLLQSFVLAALSSLSLAALADDPPAAVGRISSVQGQVTVLGGEEPAAAILNWPVTSDNHVTTMRGARTEFRIGSTAVRVDGDSDLEVIDLDDDVLRMRLNYGSAIVRIKDPELLRNFELSTPQGRVTMIDPGEVRVDSERIADTTSVSVLSGSSRVDGAGSSLVLNTGRRADVGVEDVRTGFSAHDGFDDWAQARDRQSDSAISTRYIPTEITGYEELDQNGTWRDTADYGPVWTPRVVSADWAPYRDGRWIWVNPWGWTWVDNAPWGYAPSHYGRWVLVDRRWCWAPGRVVGRPVWSPALVGWVGGDSLTVTFGSRGRAPATGWFPLAPRDTYVPAYRVSVEQERRLVWTHNGRVPEHRDVRDYRDHHDGVTVVPRTQFEGHHVVAVTQAPHANLAPAQAANAAVVAPPAAPPGAANRVREIGRREWDDRAQRQNNQQPGRVITAPQSPNYAQQPQQLNPQQQAQQQQFERERRERAQREQQLQTQQQQQAQQQGQQQQAQQQQLERERRERAQRDQQLQTQQQQQSQQQAQQQQQFERERRERTQREQQQQAEMQSQQRAQQQAQQQALQQQQQAERERREREQQQRDQQRDQQRQFQAQQAQQQAQQQQANQPHPDQQHHENGDKRKEEREKKQQQDTR